MGPRNEEELGANRQTTLIRPEKKPRILALRWPARLRSSNLSVGIPLAPFPSPDAQPARLALGDTSERPGESDSPRARARSPSPAPPPGAVAQLTAARRGAAGHGEGRGSEPPGGERVGVRVAAPSGAGLRGPPPTSVEPPRLTSGGRGRRAAAAAEKEPAPAAVARGARAQGRRAEPGRGAVAEGQRS